MTDNINLTDYYTNLLLLQYKSKLKATSTISAIVALLLVYDLAIKVRDGYDIDTAIGAQQDILGKYIGVSRIVTGTTFSKNYFWYPLYSDTLPLPFELGYATYSQGIVDEKYRQYADETTSIYSLTDPEFQTVLKLKIVQNYGNNSLKSIDELVNEFFGSNVLLFDPLNMTISYYFPLDQKKLVAIARSEGLLPKPTGVSLSVSLVPDINNVFGFKLYGQSAPTYEVGFKLYGTAKTGGWAFYG